MRGWILLILCSCCVCVVGEASKTSSYQNRFDPTVYEYAMEKIVSNLIDGKYYVLPEHVYVTERGIFLNVDNIVVEVESLAKDDQGLYVHKDKVIGIVAIRERNTILHSTVNIFRKVNSLFHRCA